MSRNRQVAVRPASSPSVRRSGAVQPVAPAAEAAPFFSFSWSVTEVSSVRGRTRIESRTTRLADGRVTSEKFEGELGGDAYDRIARQTLDQLAAPMRMMLQPFGWLLRSAREPDE